MDTKGVFSNLLTEGEFISRIKYELKRAERYRIFLSLAIFNFGPVVDMAGNGSFETEEDRARFMNQINEVVKDSVREIDAVSNTNHIKVGLLMPETSRQGAEAVAQRLAGTLTGYCSDYFGKPDGFLIPIEISSFPDASGAKSIASYLEELTGPE
ncbi:MAG: hypothetical protein JSV44_09240 [Candidatus Zixiibacteriota bacterium]|nr:MAG: hypothetical protein JSV44_09240 [candidate division Zixibacteria bacterium]